MNRTMPAVVNYAPEPNSVEIREVPVPEIGDNDVLLAVQAVGVCGSDIHLAYGQNRGKLKYPVILGHEFARVIVQAGKNVRREHARTDVSDARFYTPSQGTQGTRFDRQYLVVPCP